MHFTYISPPPINKLYILYSMNYTMCTMILESVQIMGTARLLISISLYLSHHGWFVWQQQMRGYTSVVWDGGWYIKLFHTGAAATIMLLLLLFTICPSNIPTTLLLLKAVIQRGEKNTPRVNGLKIHVKCNHLLHTVFHPRPEQLMRPKRRPPPEMTSFYLLQDILEITLQRFLSQFGWSPVP